MQNSAEARYDRLSDEFFDLYYTYHPPHATRQGLHKYDHHLGHYRRDEIEETLRRMKAVQAQVAQIDPDSMDRRHGIDHAVLTTYPTHLTYHIGCEMVRKLRADYEAACGSDFVLKEFHDRFMTYGLIPLAVIRQDMLGAADDRILF
jgi:hypothetical protein